MRIRVFYGNYEVLSTDTKQTESERLIRISHGCHMVEPRKLELGLLCQLFGPPTARQIELPPAVNNNSREVMKVMDFIKRGIILEINESNDIIVTRLCLARVSSFVQFCSFLLVDTRSKRMSIVGFDKQISWR